MSRIKKAEPGHTEREEIQTGIRFMVDFFEAGSLKYQAGSVYAENSETLRELCKGNAERVEL